MKQSNIFLVAFCLLILSTRITTGHTGGLIAIVNTHEILHLRNYADRSKTKTTCNSLINFSLITSLAENSARRAGADYECTFHLDYNPVCHPLEKAYINFCDKHVVEKDKALHKQTVFDPLRPTQPTIATTEGTVSQRELLLKGPVIPVVGPVYTPWKCLMEESYVCDGLSMCLSDECGCKDVDVFYCADSAGCISHANVCDGIEDCRDGSDECMCDDVIHCTFKDHTYCIPRREYCIYRTTTHRSCVTKHAVDCLDEKEDQINAVYQCVDNFVAENTENSSHNFAEFCEKNCHFKMSKLCQHLVQPSLSNFMALGLLCSSLDGNNKGETLAKYQICDGIADCTFGTDEIYCPDVYFCNGSSNSSIITWIDADKVCDNNKDCPAGDDECQGCINKDGTSVGSDTNMVESIVIRCFMVVGTALSLSLNIFAGIEIARKDAESRTAKVDKLILLVLSGYDMLTGLCVGFTFVKSMIYSGKYCLHDREWRASLQCKILGCLFSFSAHGSLLMVSILSLTRCYKCVFNRTLKVKVIATITTALLFVNAFHSVLPILPISAVQDIFRASMTFTDNPFAPGYNNDMTELERKYRVYKGDSAATPDTYTMLHQLNNISSKPGIFDPEELGYYSYSPLCIQNIFGGQKSLVVYKVVYMINIMAFLIVTSISYAAIVFHAHKVSNAVQHKSSNQVLAFKFLTLKSFRSVNTWRSILEFVEFFKQF